MTHTCPLPSSLWWRLTFGDQVGGLLQRPGEAVHHAVGEAGPMGPDHRRKVRRRLAHVQEQRQARRLRQTELQLEALQLSSPAP